MCNEKTQLLYYYVTVRANHIVKAWGPRGKVPDKQEDRRFRFIDLFDESDFTDQMEIAFNQGPAKKY